MYLAFGTVGNEHLVQCVISICCSVYLEFFSEVSEHLIQNLLIIWYSVYSEFGAVYT